MNAITTRVEIMNLQDHKACMHGCNTYEVLLLDTFLTQYDIETEMF